MITIEVFFTIGLGLIISSLYIMYKYLDDRIECLQKRINLVSQEENATRNQLEDMNALYSSRPPTGGGPSWYQTIKKLDDKIVLLQNQLKDGIQGNANCCKAGIEKSNREMFNIDDRLRTIEQWLFSKESKNENGERVISVIVPKLKDVPLTSEPLVVKKL